MRLIAVSKPRPRLWMSSTALLYSSHAPSQGPISRMGLVLFDVGDQLFGFLGGKSARPTSVIGTSVTRPMGAKDLRGL